MTLEYNAILKYNFDEAEIRAYKLCLLWIQLSEKYFPDYVHTQLKKGDPRNSFLFKICHKLQRERQGVLEEIDYPLYVRSQLEIMRALTKNNSNPDINPTSLVGPKAWTRWKLWKKKYDTRFQTTEQTVLRVSQNKICIELERTKEFFCKTFGGFPTAERFQESLCNKNLFRWISVGKVSPYYLILSPLIRGVVTNEIISKNTNLDLEIYRVNVTTDVEDCFKNLFEYEFSS